MNVFADQSPMSLINMIVSSSGNAMVILDERAHVVVANSAAVAAVGVKAEGITNREMASFVASREDFENFLASGLPRYQGALAPTDSSSSAGTFVVNRTPEENSTYFIVTITPSASSFDRPNPGIDKDEKYRRLVEYSGDAVTIFTAAGTPLYFSPSMTAILGYEEADAMQKELFPLIHPEDLPFVKKAWDKIIKSPGRTFFNNVCRIRHANGSWRWINGTLTNLLHDPEVRGIVDNFRDVTDLIEAGSHQRMLTDRYRYLFNHNPVPMWIYEPSSLRFIEVNDAAIHRYGFTREEFLRMTLHDIRPTEEAEKLQQAVRSRIGKAYHQGGTWKHKTKAGETIYVEISSHDIVHEGISGVLVLAHDVTERTKALELLYKSDEEKKVIQEAIRLAKERYDMVSRATNDVIYEWDIVNQVNYWSEGFRTLFGHQETGENLPLQTWVDNLHPDERDELFRITNQAFSEHKTSLSREIRFRCADGSYKIVFDNFLILYNEAGAPVKIVGAMQDITARKEQEKALNQLNETLNQRAQELVRSNEELERFAYIASHDLQEPLRMVSSFLQLLQKNYQSSLDERANRYIAFAVDGAVRMRKLILDLLAYSQVSNRQHKQSRVDPNLMMDAIRLDMNNRIRKKNVDLQIDHLPAICGNETQVNQLFRNLISNAIKYNEAEHPKVHVGFNELPDHIEFFVADNGIGIEQQFLEKIFIIFQRLHQKTEYSGTGIGLAICKKIVELHGGTIRVESKPGLGSTFFFTLAKAKNDCHGTH